MQFHFVNDSLGKNYSGIKYRLGKITHGHHVTNINICNTFNLKQPVTQLVKRLALSQEMLSCLKARSTHSAGRVHSKLALLCCSGGCLFVLFDSLCPINNLLVI